jgi:hypothetical protein
MWDFIVAEEHLGDLLVEITPSFEHDPSFFRLVGFQRGVTVASRSQFGLPA